LEQARIHGLKLLQQISVVVVSYLDNPEVFKSSAFFLDTGPSRQAPSYFRSLFFSEKKFRD